MSSRQNRLRLFCVLFVGFNWMLDLVAVRLALIGEFAAAKPILLGAIFAQIGLLGAWLVIHPHKIAAQTILALAFAAVLAQPLARYSSLPDKKWWGVFLAFLVVSTAGSWLMRNSFLVALFRSQEGNRRRRQMSIGGIFALTTCAAVSVGIAPYVQMPSRIGFLLGASLAFAFLGQLRMALTPLQASSLIVAAACWLAAMGTWFATGLPISTFVAAGLALGVVVLLAGLILRLAASPGNQNCEATAVPR